MAETLRSVRRARGWGYRKLAHAIGVDPTSLLYWEQGTSQPSYRHWHQVIDFLGYDPHPHPRTLAETLRAIRRALGLGQRELAARIGGHPRMILAWEAHVGRPAGVAARKLGEFLAV